MSRKLLDSYKVRERAIVVVLLAKVLSVVTIMYQVMNPPRDFIAIP